LLWSTECMLLWMIGILISIRHRVSPAVWHVFSIQWGVADAGGMSTASNTMNSLHPTPWFTSGAAGDECLV